MLVMSHRYNYTFVSLENLQSTGLDIESDISDLDRLDGENLEQFYLSKLTKRQRYIAVQLSAGYSRKDVAKELGISLQAIHQIVLRMQKRLRSNFNLKNSDEKQEEILYKNLIWIMVTIAPNLSYQNLLDLWESHPVLKDYKKPIDERLQRWFKEAMK